MTDCDMVIVFTAKRLAQVFGAIVLCLISAHVVVQTIRFATGDERVFGLVYLLSVGRESNLPTFYSSFAILFCAFLLTLIGFMMWRSERRWSVYWFLLALVFVFLSVDESLMIHERLSKSLQSLIGTSGLLYFAWVIPYGIGVVIFVAAYVRFLLHIPRRSAVLFIIAGAMYVGGAIVMEMIGGHVYTEAGALNALYVSVQTLEEFLEMSGIVFFIFALVDYIEKFDGELQLILGRD